MARNQVKYLRLQRANGGKIFLTDVLALACWGATAALAIGAYIKAGQYTLFENAHREVQAARNSMDIQEAHAHLKNAQDLIHSYDGYKTHIDTSIDASQKRLDGLEHITNEQDYNSGFGHVKSTIKDGLEAEVGLERSNLDQSKWGLSIGAILSGTIGFFSTIGSLDKRGR